MAAGQCLSLRSLQLLGPWKECCHWLEMPGGAGLGDAHSGRGVVGSASVAPSSQTWHNSRVLNAQVKCIPQLGENDGPRLHLRVLFPFYLGSLTPIFYLLTAQFPLLSEPWCPSLYTSFLSPTSYSGAPPPPISQYLFPGKLVADSGPRSSQSDPDLDGSRAMPEVRIFFFLLGRHG